MMSEICLKYCNKRKNGLDETNTVTSHVLSNHGGDGGGAGCVCSCYYSLLCTFEMFIIKILKFVERIKESPKKNSIISWKEAFLVKLGVKALFRFNKDS